MIVQNFGTNSEIDRICMFFEASNFGCRKTTCEVMKVTYNMYSCDTCGISREIIEMEGRDSAKCRKSKRKDMIGIIEFD